MIRVVAAVFAAGVLAGACAVWAWQLLGPRPIPIAWDGTD